MAGERALHTWPAGRKILELPEALLQLNPTQRQKKFLEKCVLVCTLIIDFVGVFKMAGRRNRAKLHAMAIAVAAAVAADLSTS